jgi:hypothetical protein
MAYYTFVHTGSVAGSALGALRVLLLDVIQQLLQFEVGILDLASIGHHSVLHGLVDDLDLVHLVHGSSAKHLVVRLSDVEGNEFHLSKIAHNVDIVPSLGDSSEHQGVVELSGPEKGDVVNWELLASHVQTSN